MKYILSFVIPVYNKQKYLNRLIESILSQNIKGIEIILIDDGSTDKSGEICDDYSRKYNNILTIHTPNGGVSQARNIGIQNASGQYITFADADDYYLPNSFHNIMDKIAGVDGLFFGWVDEKDGNIIERKKNISFEKDVSGIESLDLVVHPWNGYRGYVWNKIFKTDLVKDINFDSQFSHCEDLLWLCEVLKNLKSIRLSDENIYCHVFYTGSLSHHSIKSEKDIHVFNAREKIINVISEIENAQKIAKMAYHWEYLNLLWNEVFYNNKEGIELIRSKYNQEYENIYFEFVSIRSRIMAILLNKMANKNLFYNIYRVSYIILSKL